MLIYIFILIILSVRGQDFDYHKNIITGPNNYYLGININPLEYPINSTYNINDPDNPYHVKSIIQQALNDIGNNGGGILLIKSGLYISVSNLFIIGNYTKITGEGIDKTIIRLANYAPSYISGTRRFSGFLRAQSLSHIIVSNMTLDGNKNNQYYDFEHKYGRFGIFTEACDNIWFDNVRVISFQGYGFDPHGWKSKNIWGNYLTITNCVAEDNDTDGFTLDQTFYIYVFNSTANNNGRHGFNIVTGSKYIILKNNTATNNGYYNPYGGPGCAITLQNNLFYGTSDAIIKNNVAINNQRSGLCLNDVYGIYFGNNIIDYSNYCYHLTNVYSTIITENNCRAAKELFERNTTVVHEYGPISTSFVRIHDNIFVPINNSRAIYRELNINIIAIIIAILIAR